MVAFVKRRATALDAEDLVDAACVELADRLHTSAEKYPRSWFLNEAPTPTEELQFRGLVWQICKRRLQDQLRREYVRRQQSGGLPHAEASPNPETVTIAKQLLVRLAEEIDSLSLEDRELLASTLESEGRAPISNRNRMRLSRLRRELATKISHYKHRPGS
jgi:hypothetical protein